MTYDELMRDVIGARPKFEEPEELMKILKQLVNENEELNRRIKNLHECNRYYKKANVALMNENHKLKWGEE